MSNQDVKRLYQPLLVPMLCFWGLSVLTAYFLADWRIIYSSTLGLVFGFWAFQNLAKTQNKILNQGKERFFLPYINRLLIYAVPIALGISKKEYFNLAIILIFLWSFQILFIFKEFVSNYRSYKKKLKDGKYR